MPSGWPWQFGITVFIVPLPKYLVDAEEILGFTALAATILFIYLVFHKRGDSAVLSSARRYWRPIRWISNLLDKMAGGIRDIGRSRLFYSSFGISLFLLLGQILSYWFVMLAYGLELSFWHGAAIFLIVHIGTVIPSAPSNVGTYQFFTVVGLTLFGINKTLATSFSVVVFLILTIPLWVIGMLVFARLGLSLKKIQTDISSLAGRGNQTERINSGELLNESSPILEQASRTNSAGASDCTLQGLSNAEAASRLSCLWCKPDKAP